MSFRTKLLCVVAVPVIGLTAIAGLAASEGLGRNGLAMVAVATALFSVFVGLLVARRVAHPLQELTEAADALATDQLPALVDGIAAPSEEDFRYLTATIQPIAIDRDDEVGKLARAFNAIQTVAVDAAAEQAALVRKGIADLFVNLARRNQALIDRQIELFDELESSEDDPDQLAQLYRLDHLATRMRRNAESLLVLAGVEPARRRTRPVDLIDVARAALGEIEDYPRVDIATFDEVQVPGTVAVDLGHLLAELLENAAQLSPPEARVKLEGRMNKGGYTLTIADAGVGMSAEELAAANSVLASPPPVGLALGRTLGLIVVGRLAARHGVTVRVRAGETSGVVATINLPSRLTIVPVPEDESGAGAAPVTASDGVAPNHAEPADARTERAQMDDADFDELVRRAWSDEPEHERSWVAPMNDRPAALPHREPKHEMPDEPAPAQLADALPQGIAFEHGLRRLTLGDDVLGPPTLVEPEVPPVEPVADLSGPGAANADPALPEADTDGNVDASAGEADADDADADELPPLTFQQSSNPLAQRTPKAPDVAPEAPGARSIAASARSPEEVRSMLARYRRGLQFGQAGAVPPRDEDGDV